MRHLPFTALNSTVPTVHISTNMNFDFHLQGTPIKPSEATALLTATGLDPLQGLRIDLEKFLDMRKVNSKMLFDLSVKEGNQELASLAWRISMGRSDKTQKIASPRTLVRAAKPAYEEQVLSLEDIIDKLHRSDAYWAAGVALIVSRTTQEEWTTLRRIATEFVNDCWITQSLPNNSTAYRGFVLGDAGFLQPCELVKGVERKKTFHVSPMYISLREGMLFCQKHNLIEVLSDVSVGSSNPNRDRRAKDMRRVFYKIRASEKGVALAELWSDCESFAKLLFRKRIER